MGVCESPACPGTSRLPINLGNERISWRATSSESVTNVHSVHPTCLLSVASLPLSGVSVCADRVQEVEAPQWNISLLLLLLQRRVQRGSLWLPRNHARWGGTVRAQQVANKHRLSSSASVSQGASEGAATVIKDTQGSCTGPAAAAP